MQNYLKVLTQFIDLGYQQNELIGEGTLSLILDHLSFNSTQNDKFDSTLVAQLWQHSKQTFQQHLRAQKRVIQIQAKRVNNEVPIFIICETICKAQGILSTEIEQIQKSLQQELEKKERQAKLVQLYSAYEQHKSLTWPFKLTPMAISSYIKQAIDLVQHAVRPQTNIFSLNPIFDGSDLEITFRLGVFMLVIELILLLQKTHFYNLMSIIMILAIFGLNYFDRYYVRVLITALGITSIIDMIWIINKFKFYLYPKSPTLYSKMQDYFLKFILLGVFLLIVLKFLQIALLLKYRNISSNAKIVVDIGWMRITLDAKVGKNPLSKIIFQTFGEQ